MLSEKMEKALNDQINAELYSAYLYQSMAAWFTYNSMDGFANWMNAQAQEENMHAMKFYSHIHERGGRVKLRAIDEPQHDWKSALEIFEASYEHEQKVTGMINNLVNLAIEEKDHASNSFLQWFVNEQVEEEDNVSTIVDQLKFVGDAGQGLFMLDRELGQRTFNPSEADAEAQ